jgi:hypothetical protein
VRCALEGDPRLTEMLDPAVIVLEVDDVGVVLAPTARTGRLSLTRGEKVDDGACQGDRSRTTAAPWHAGPEHLGIKTLGPLDIRGDERPVIEPLDRRCLNR